jgi:hypothetical protein
MSKNLCQSCSMPLDGENNGTEADGSRSVMYCQMCYEDGKFIDPELTLEEMKAIVDRSLREKGWNRFKRWATLAYLPSLERWKATSAAGT